ncbi:MAG TPA: DUF898 domain-containing protein [Candidatus Aquabacterium excrementipullorum]|nr:DUF898 domain-containing protein [Candidatus Aquabacterium excrementipullorum]
MLQSDDPSASVRDASPLITGNLGAPSPVQRHPIEFTGSGSEYFRIWIVNLLLTLVTFGLYYPWAKVRKLRYFYGNTHVAGHALDFHGDPKRMLRGFLLMAALLLVYNVALKASPLAGGIAFLIFMAVWPALLRASMQFRLANTSWRGLRLQFTGSLKDAYLVFLIPVLVMAGFFGVGFALIATKNMAGIVAGGLLMVMAYLGALPYAYYRFKKYQHQNYVYGQLRTEFRASFGDVVKICLKTFGLAIGLGIAASVLVGIIGGASLVGMGGGARRGAEAAAMAFPVMIFVMVAVYAVPIPYIQSRMQNLVWTQTGCRDLRFKSQLNFGPMLKQTLINWTLMVFTLGLYWPFAAIAMARLRLQAVSIHARIDLDTLVSRQKGSLHREGVGDAAADLAGIDFGL